MLAPEAEPETVAARKSGACQNFRNLGRTGESESRGKTMPLMEDYPEGCSV